MVADPQITAEIERIINEKDAKAAESLKTAVVVGVGIVGAYIMTRRVVYRSLKRQARREANLQNR